MSISYATQAFWAYLDKLPPDVRSRAEKQFELFALEPSHPSLHLKQVGSYWSVRVTDSYRALAVRKNDIFTLFWIGSHDEYERKIYRP